MKLIIDISEEEYNLIKMKSESNIGGVSSEAEQVITKGIPLPKGEWVYREELFDDEDKPRMAYGCSICGHSIKSVHEKGNYCPNCGARMINPQESEEV